MPTTHIMKALLRRMLDFDDLYIGLLIYSLECPKYDQFNELSVGWYQRQPFVLDQSMAVYSFPEEADYEGFDAVAIFDAPQAGGGNLLIYISYENDRLTAYPGGGVSVDFSDIIK